MKLFCSKCGLPIYQNNVNIEKDTCFCSNCHEFFILSEILNHDDIKKITDMLSYPPKGTWIRKGVEQLTIGVSTRSKSAFFLLIFGTLFSGTSTLGFYQMIRDRTIIGIFFMLPFIIASIFIIWQFFYSIFGKIEITFNISDKVQVFIGIGTIGKKYHIDWESIKGISMISTFDSESGVTKKLHIESEKAIKISMQFINEEKSKFLLLMLKHFKEKTISEIIL